LLINCAGIVETETGFRCEGPTGPVDWSTDARPLLVQAHEKAVYLYNETMVLTKVHRQNGGDYPFSKLDFLTHKLQEIVFPGMCPTLFGADFTDGECPCFLLEKIPLDDCHKAYNILHQEQNSAEGRNYSYDKRFFSLSQEADLQQKARQHLEFVKTVQQTYSNSLSRYGIAFDHAAVNMTQRNGLPIAIEMHKCLRPYLFNYERCRRYFTVEHPCADESSTALLLLGRIGELLGFAQQQAIKQPRPREREAAK
jgi:hypothetical protein